MTPPLELFRKFIRFGSVTRPLHKILWPYRCKIIFVQLSCIYRQFTVLHYSSLACLQRQPPTTIDKAFVKSSPRLYRAIWSSEASLHFLVHSSSSQRKTKNWKGPFIHKEIQISLWDFCIILRQTSVSGTHVCLPVGQAKSSKKTVFLLFGRL